MIPDLHPADSSQLVMDVGGSHVTAARVALSSGRAEILQRNDVELDSLGSRAEILDTLEAAARPLAIGDAPWSVAMPGPFDYPLGTGSFEGIGKFGAIAGLDLRGALADRLGTRPDGVGFLNDADAYGIGEWAFGHAGPRPDRLVCVTLGTGVGSAFVREGVAVDDGDDVPLDGGAYTLAFDGKPLEETVSTRAIRAGYAARSGEDIGVAEIAQRARAGDAAAAAAFTAPMDALGRTIGPWLARFGASVLVVGGAMSRSWSLLEGALHAGLTESLSGRALEVRPSRLLDDAPLLGAAEWARRAQG
ncbi:glucokinase [Frondihabitans sucicola]|uniref:Glucokinase n=1 Tax=Frondihabitans sucicola TaxID=1268041 RepID=A0ABM8GM64_9MICO|nr:ROK family protein [Frondihabitans sucicola]BDZ49491.1 glucokinase [Frondihabitans sucicola]